jgi:hypothetical protein
MPNFYSGNTKILYATNGVVVTNLDLGISFPSNPNAPLATDHQDTDCAWDAVGNVYYTDYTCGIWRVFSPPGANQATTVAVPALIIPPPPQITKITFSKPTVTIQFTATAGDLASNYKLQSAPVPAGTAFTNNTAATITALGTPGLFQATVPASGNVQFYRVSR